MTKTCGSCVFFIYLCKNPEALIVATEEYCKGRYAWTRRHEALFNSISDDDGVCLIKCKIVASDEKACRNYVNRSKALLKLNRCFLETKSRR